MGSIGDGGMTITDEAIGPELISASSSFSGGGSMNVGREGKPLSDFGGAGGGTAVCAGTGADAGAGTVVCA